MMLKTSSNTSSPTKPPESTGPFCPNPNHLPKTIFFCKNCANCRQPLAVTFYCKECHPQFQTNHRAHLGDKMAIASNEFKTIYNEFKKQMATSARLAYVKHYQTIHPGKHTPAELIVLFKNHLDSVEVPFKVCLKTAADPNINKTDFADHQYRQWLITFKFWTEKPSNSLPLKNEIDLFIKKAFGGVSEIKNKWAFPIPIKPETAEAQSIDYKTEMNKLKSQIAQNRKQQQLGDLFVQITSYFSDKQIEKGLQQISKLQNQLNDNSITFLFYLAKLKILELHSLSSQKLSEVLNEASFPNTTIREKEFHYYFTAISEWRLVPEPQNQPKQTKLFYQPRNKQHYKMANPNNYIKALTAAIQLVQKTPKPLYFASRAVGYLILDQNEKAQEDFQRAETLRNDAILNNRNLNSLKRKKQLNKTLLRQALSEKSTEYIINVSKHLKKNKDYEQLKLYYKELVDREPFNLAFRKKQFENTFKLGDKDGAIVQLSHIKNLNEMEQDQVLECERKVELLKARQTEKFQNFEDAQERYEHVASMGKPSATHWYNYAAFLFTHRDKIDKADRALAAINKAIEISPKPHFHQLKYLLLFIAGNLEEAKKMHPLLNDPADKFLVMKTHVIDFA